MRYNSLTKGWRLRAFILSVFLAVIPAAITNAATWALPDVSVTILRGQPRHSAEQVSQVVCGTPLKVTETTGEWCKVETPEGYTGYIRSNTLKMLDDNAMKQWRQSPRVVVHTDRTVYIHSGASEDSDRVSDVVSGAILQLGNGATPAEGWQQVILPSGRNGYVRSADIMTIEQWAAQEWTPSMMPVYGRRMLGTPYVWGGTSLKGMDCSGFTQICAYHQGVMLPRDASQQVKVGTAIDKSDYSNFQPGDLLFFGNVRTGRITHVAISLGGAGYIHSSGRVRVSSLDKSAPDYENPGLIAVRRIDPATASRLSLRTHPFYF